jgi:type IV pilus assembly protein PilW
LNVDSTNGFASGNLVIVTDGNNASLLEITQVQTAALKLQHNPGAGNINPPGGHNIFPSGGYGVGSKVYKARYVSYKVTANNPLHPVLAINFQGPNGAGGYQPLANNIEDMELVYIFADGGEGTSYNDTDADPSNDYDDIRAIRINILARSDKPERNFSGRRPAIEDHAAGGADAYRRRILCSTVKIRNMGL